MTKYSTYFFINKNFEFYPKSLYAYPMPLSLIVYSFKTIKTSLIITSTGADDNLFHGISISNDPIYENFIEKGRLFLLIN